MKKSLMIIAAIVMMVGLTSAVMAQDTENTAAGAKIVKALTLTETSALHFGTMTIPTGAVDVVLSTATSRTTSGAGTITLLPQSPPATNAAYDVAGSIGATYAITLPANGVVTLTNGAVTMAIKNFVAKTASAGIDGLTGTLDGTGDDSFSVGATLVLDDAQAFGVYAGAFDVSVDYN